MLSNGVGIFSATLHTPGSQTITVADSLASSITGTSNAITVIGPATHFVIGNPTSATAGSGFVFTVTAQDVLGQTAVGYSGNVHFSSSDPHAGLPADSTLLNGVGVFNATLVTAGSQTLTATDSTTGSLTGVSSPVSVSAAAATHLALSGVPANITAGNPFLVTVTAKDQYNNTASSYGGTLQFSSSDSQAILPQAETLSAGVGAFNATLRTAGSQTLTANSANINVNATVQVAPALSTHFAVTAPANATAGAAFVITATALDEFKNVATGYGGSVQFSSNDGAASLPAPSVLTNGVGTFSVILRTLGAQTVTISDTQSSSIAGISGPVTVNSPVSSQFVLSAPSVTTAGSAFTFTVTAADQFNRTATGYNGFVQFTSSDSLAGLPSNAPLTSGVGVFTATLKIAGVQTIVATDTVASNITGMSSAIAVASSRASHFAVSAPPNETAGGLFVFGVTALDDFNNSATGYTGNVHITSSDSQAVLPANGPLTSGSGSFAMTLKTAGTQTLSANDALTGTITGSTTPLVSAIAANHLAVSAPAAILPNSPFVFTVTAEDRFNNVAPTYGGTVHFSSSDSLGQLSPNGTLTSGSGQFAANLVTLGNQTITATDTVTSSITGTSKAINVTNNPPVATHFVFSVPSQTTSGQALLVSVTAEDQFNHTFAGYTGTVHFASSDSQAEIPGNMTLANGTGSFVVLFKTAGEQTLTATDTVVSTLTGTTSAVTVNAAAVARFAVTTVLPSYPGVRSGPTSFASTGVPLSFTVTVQDTYGNTVPNYNGTVHFFSTDPGVGVVRPANSTLANGTGNFSYTLMTPGYQTIGVTDVTTGLTGFSAPLATRGLVVTSFTPTPTGFAVTFNKPFNIVNVDLYTAASLPDDVILATTSTQVSVRGSLIFNSSNTPTGFTFVKTAAVNAEGTFSPTSGLLAVGNYTLTLRSFTSGSSGFQDMLGGLLDGNNSGNPGVNFKVTFSVSPPPVAVGIPDFARGFSNTDAVFLPSTLGSGSTFTLSYTNPNTSSKGTATVTFSTTAATLQSNIQNALNKLPQISMTGTTPNAVVIVVNDSTSSGANLTVTFQNSLVSTTSQLLSSSTASVSISLANINAANSIVGDGIPISLSNGLGVTSGSFTLQYNPTMLSITGAVSKISGATFTLNVTTNNATSATAILSLSKASPISTTSLPLTIGSLLATVPLSAIYGSRQMLHFSAVQLNGTAGTMPITSQDGVEVAAFLGDVTESGGPFTVGDASAIAAAAAVVANTTALTLPGFAAFRNIDPVIVGDVAMQGFVSFTDASVMNQELVSARAAIPFAPAGIPDPPASQSAAPNLPLVETATATAPTVDASPATTSRSTVRLSGRADRPSVIRATNHVSEDGNTLTTAVRDLALLQVLASRPSADPSADAFSEQLGLWALSPSTSDSVDANIADSGLAHLRAILNGEEVDL
jgi:hypothetical protein